jgi:hypothetical protein
MTTLCIEGVDDIVTVYNNSTDEEDTFKISKLALITASGYFEAFFDKDWEEVRIPVIHLWNRGSSELDVLLGALAEHGAEKFAGAIDRDLTDSVYDAGHICGEAFENAVRMYKTADKYDVPALHKVLVESTFPTILEAMYEIDYFDGNFQGVFGDCFYHTISDELGSYPQSLYWIICKGVDWSICHNGNADLLIRLISSDAQLLEHILRYLLPRVSGKPRLLASLAKRIAAAPEGDEDEDVGEQEQSAVVPVSTGKRRKVSKAKTADHK